MASFTFSYTANWIARDGATLRQLAPLPLKKPSTPSARYSSSSCERMLPSLIALPLI